MYYRWRQGLWWYASRLGETAWGGWGAENARAGRAVAGLTVANQASGEAAEGDLVSPTRAWAGKCAPTASPSCSSPTGLPRADNAPRVHQPGRAEMAWPRRSPVRSSPGPAAPGRERLRRRALTASCGTSHTGREVFYTPRKPRPRSRAGARTTPAPPPKTARVTPTSTRNHHACTRLPCGPLHQPATTRNNSHTTALT